MRVSKSDQQHNEQQHNRPTAPNKNWATKTTEARLEQTTNCSSPVRTVVLTFFRENKNLKHKLTKLIITQKHALTGKNLSQSEELVDSQPVLTA